MTRQNETSEDILQITTGYSEQEVEFLRDGIITGLHILRDTGKQVNYEEMCQSMMGSLHPNIDVPEWRNYWEYWEARFKSTPTSKKRKQIFKDCILDLKRNGLIVSKVSGLTSNFSTLITEILKKPTDEL